MMTEKFIPPRYSFEVIYMKAKDLKLEELVRFKPEEGKIEFKGGRMVMLDTDTMGALRDVLLEGFGEDIGRAIFTRFGYKSGHDDVMKLKKLYDWDNETEWITSGPMMHMLEGIVLAGCDKIEFDRDKNYFDMCGPWRNSYEAGVHLKLFGKSKEPVCWTLVGYCSGYATGFFGKELIGVEEKCVGKGDDVCYYHIKTMEQWGDDPRAKRVYQDLKEPLIV